MCVVNYNIVTEPRTVSSLPRQSSSHLSITIEVTAHTRALYQWYGRSGPEKETAQFQIREINDADVKCSEHATEEVADNTTKKRQM